MGESSPQCVPAVVVEVSIYTVSRASMLRGNEIQNLRETLHVQPCNARSSLTDLKAMFPDFIFPATLTEEDEVWQPESVRGRETRDELFARAKAALDECIKISEGDTCQ